MAKSRSTKAIASKAKAAFKKNKKIGQKGINEITTVDLLKDVPEALSKTLHKEAVAAGAKMAKLGIQLEARLHRSKLTGTRELWSDKEAAYRQSFKDYFDSLVVVTRDYKNGPAAFVGPSGDTYWALIIEFGGNFPNWNRSRTYREPVPIMRNGTKRAEGEVERAMLKVLSKFGDAA